MYTNDNSFNKVKGDLHFKNVISILSSYDIPYWVDQGTLLGIIRDKEIIPWEWDLDFGVFENEISRKKVEKAFLENGFIKEKISNKNKCLHFLYNNERKVDITFYEKKEDYALTYFEGPHGLYGRFIKYVFSVIRENRIIIRKTSLFKRFLFYLLDSILLIPNKNRYSSKLFFRIIKKRLDNLPSSMISYKIPFSYLKKRKKIIFLSTKINIPNEPIKYLEYSYGKNWNIPLKNYTWYNEKTKAYL